jgi:hypothetical protein
MTQFKNADNILLKKNKDGTYKVTFDCPTEFEGKIVNSHVAVSRAKVQLQLEPLPYMDNSPIVMHKLLKI